MLHVRRKTKVNDKDNNGNNEELHDLNTAPPVVNKAKCKTYRSTGNVAGIGIQWMH
jgi:hypothetical protein